MGLFDKVKNMFTEEVEENEEVEVEQIKKEVTHVPIESPSVKLSEEENIEIIDVDDNANRAKEKKAVFFNDRDFEDLAKPRHVGATSQNRNDEFFSKEELAKMYGTQNNKEIKEEKKEKIFKPTPIISPIYGILDKNYHKEDIVERKESTYKPKTSVNVDTVRNKAYGTLEEQLKDQVLYDRRQNTEDTDLFDELERKNDIVFEDNKNTTANNQDELTMDLTQELDNLLMKKQQTINEVNKHEDYSTTKRDYFDLTNDESGDE